MSCLTSFALLILSYSTMFPAGFNFASKDSCLKFNHANASFALKTPITNFNGTLELKDNVAQTISSATTSDVITFNQAILKTNTTNSPSIIKMSGTFNPTGTDTLNLPNGSVVDATGGPILQAINIQANATVCLTGNPQFAGNISFSGTGATLNLGLTSPLTVPIQGTGTVNLLQDLVMSKNLNLPMQLNPLGKSIHHGGGNITTSASIATSNASGGNIELHGYTNLSSALSIGDSGDNFSLSGNGAVLNLTSSGSITFNGANLYISDMHIKGLSSTNFIAGTGIINFSKVSLELGANFTRSDGSFVFAGDLCRIISNSYAFTLSGASNTLTVDGILLEYEQLDNSGNSPIATTNGASISKLRGGDIVATGSGQSGGGASNLVVSATTYTFTNNYTLSSSTGISFTNATPGTPKSITADGNGHFIHFPSNNNAYLSLADNVQLSLNNITLDNWNHKAINYATTNSTLSFSDNTALQMDHNLTIASADRAWTFNGNSSINGQGNILTIDKSSGITITGAKTLVLKNMHIITSVVDGISALTGTATVRLENVTFEIRQANYSFTQGNLEITGLTELLHSPTNTAPTTTFEFASPGNLQIGNLTSTLRGSLIVNRNVILKYNAQESTTGAADQKTHLLFAYPAAALHFRGGQMNNNIAGLILESGTLNIEDHTLLVTGTTHANSTQIKSNMNVNILANAILDVDGKLEYIA